MYQNEDAKIMFDYHTVQIHQQDQREKLAQAEQQRQHAAAPEANKGLVQFYGPVLAGIGDGLTLWGSRLQARYGTARQNRQASHTYALQR
jgi:hypothetical protein